MLEKGDRHLAQNALILEFMSPKKITSVVHADSLHHPLQNEKKSWEKRKKIAEEKVQIWLRAQDHVFWNTLI